ncbi:DUF6048 family protein [Aquimarina sp. ERC-38]|uniref:DUF6048 family protein n=1 Tax=Aquimarina sp. ERC-38 TaxID=2949996 RepID=UPI0022477BD0|nr:DUF6048 family protein [Aquimarina sp. ERC-38]UZO79511.1 DUF6048 family protein [Aquimarina sp. ERC-38]
MNKIRTFLFFSSLLFAVISGNAQEEDIIEEEKEKITPIDTLPPGEKYGLRLGIDLSRIVRTQYSEDYEGFEVVADYRIYRKFYIAGEVGNESLLRDEENINVEGSGTYFRVGVDYNTYNNWYGMQNLIFAGLRFGATTFSQRLNSYRIFTGTSIFPNQEITSVIEADDLSANWLGFMVGLKVETLKNLYLGASVTLRRLFNEERPREFDNLFIPGFGRTNDFSKYNVGYGYTISYLIPVQKKRR